MVLLWRCWKNGKKWHGGFYSARGVIAITNRLFMVEGIPGAGKSDAAEYIVDCLARRGEKADWFEENDYEHPADYTFHAYMSFDQIKELAQEEQVQLYAEGIEVLSGLVIPLTKISVSLFEKILPYKIYDKLDWEAEKPVMLNRWLSFSHAAQTNSRIYIFEGALLQNPVCEALIRFDLDFSEIREYVKAVYQTVSILRPVVVYLNRTDVKTCAEQVCRQRGDSWEKKMIGFYTGHTFAKNNGLNGLDGYIACLERRQSVELEILDALPAEKLILTDPFDNWEETKRLIDAFVDKLH